MQTTLRPRRSPSRTETAFEAAVNAFLWVFRIILVLIVVVGSFMTITSGKFTVETWVDLIVNGAVQGGIYALVALGYTMVYGIMKMINFAHGEIFMIGIFSGYFTAVVLDDFGILNAGALGSIFSILLMMGVAATISTLVALAVERVAYRPLRHSPRLVLLISAIGASYFLQYTVRGLVGPGIFRYPTVDVLDDETWLPVLSALGMTWIQVIVIGSALAMMVALYLFVMRSKTGTAIRAVSEDKETAALMGVDVTRAMVTTFGVGAAMAGAAGVLYGLYWGQVQFYTGFIPGIKAFTAAVLGGIGNIPGAMVGGFVLGEAESIGSLLIIDGLGVPSPGQLKDVIAFTILVMVLMFRPQGILGERLSRSRA
ncbi:MAG: branched-chain amino acid ABC transporter permease [Candidatus Limnocylindrales bacterium]